MAGFFYITFFHEFLNSFITSLVFSSRFLLYTNICCNLGLNRLYALPL